MKYFRFHKDYRALLIVAFAIFSSLSFADIVGRIDFVDTENNRIGIDSGVYTLPAEALTGKAPNHTDKLRASHLQPGHVVEYTHDRQFITKLRLLHGMRDIPR